MASNTRYLTPKELASYLQVSVDYLYREVLGYPEGIPAIKLGNGKRASGASTPKMLNAGNNEDASRMMSLSLHGDARTDDQEDQGWALAHRLPSQPR